MRGRLLDVLAIPTVTASALLLAGCTSPTTGTPVAASIRGSEGTPSATATSTQSLDLSPPTTATANPRVTGTTFDGCAAVTKAEEAAWELEPNRKRDTADNGPLGAESVRGCIWWGKKGQLRVYSFDGSIPNWQEANKSDYDRMEPTRFGSREGLVAHFALPRTGCTVVLPSQQGLVGVMALPSIALEDQGVDICPFATQVMTTIEPRIP